MVCELILLALVAPLAVTLAMRILADRVTAGVAVVACTAAACLLALGTVLVLFASAVHTARALVKTSRRGWSPEAWVDAAFGDDLWLTAPCALAGVGVLLCAARAWYHQRGARRAAGDEAAALPGVEVVVVVPGEHPDAFTLPGAPGRIVVTEGMRAALSADELDVVLAHERAHLYGRHHCYVDAARLAAAGQPLLRPVARLVEYGVERWADERAAVEVGDRTKVARAIGTVALVSATAPARRHPPAVMRRGTPHGTPRGSRPGRGASRPPFGSGAPGHPGIAPAPRTLRIVSLDVPARARWLARAVPIRRLLQPRPGPVPRRVLALLRPLPDGGFRALLAIPMAVAVISCLWGGNLIYDPHTPFHTAVTLRLI